MSFGSYNSIYRFTEILYLVIVKGSIISLGGSISYEY